LKNSIQRARLLCRDGRITPMDLGLIAPTSARSVADEPDRDAIESALQRARGVISQAASDLGLSRQALYRRLEKLGIRAESA
jgi:transcriptional regulator of acetoin/glycerol metabolism